MRRLGIVVFSSHTGLGYQSHRLTQFLKPERILLIDNSTFSKNKDQHPEWYEGFNGYQVTGFPSRIACLKFLDGLTHLYVIENPLNWDLITIAKNKGIKVYIASNFEFCDNLIHPDLPLPDIFLMPSYWKIEEMKTRFGNNKVIYLPPPIFPQVFKEARDLNLNRKGKKRFLHIVGTLAVADRNGTLALLDSLQFSKADYELVIKTQHELPKDYVLTDKRISYQIGSDPSVENIYKDYDALIIPRRFGGLCLPMQEALMSGLAVVMPDISPNSEILKKDWLIPATITGKIRTRTEIDLYESDIKSLAIKLDDFSKKDLDKDKLDAFEIAMREFAPSALEERYNDLWK